MACTTADIENPNCAKEFAPLARVLSQEDNVSIKDRGFASMDPEKRREIARKGGKAAHEKGTAHEWTPEEAREAGRKSGVRMGSVRAQEEAPQDLQEVPS
jgi:general stress protein YciG